MFAPITTALTEAVNITNRQLMLDVAGGAGEPSITIAETLSDTGWIVCTDAINQMVLTSRAEANRRSLTNIDFACCPAEALPFQTSTFDAAVCRLGVMLFTDPLTASGEMFRVVKPAAPVAFAVWNHRDSNPFFHVLANILSRYVESPPEDPDTPGAFRFAEPGKLADLLVRAGAIEVTEQLLKFNLEAPITPRQFWEVRTELSDTLRSKLATLPPEQVANMANEVEEAGREFYDGGRMSFPAEVWIVSGRKLG
jgi:SAM-dependent methyltransferase